MATKAADLTFTILAGLLGLTFLALYAVSIRTACDLFSKAYFNSDGFHYYSALRNAAFHASTWEGPVFEHLLGNHFYLTIYLLTPLVRLFPSPLTLLLVNLTAQFVTAAGLYVLVSYHVKGHRHFIGAAVALAYVLTPMVMKGYFAGIHMLQPDYLLPPLLVFFVIGASTNRHGFALVMVALIILLKEEYIVVGPLIFGTFVLLYRIHTGRWIAWKSVRVGAWVYGVASVVSVSLLFHFRALNHANHVMWAIHPHPEFLADLPSLFHAFVNNLPLLWFAIPPLLLLCVAGERWYWVAFSAILATLWTRGIMNLVIYGRPQGTHWAWTLLPPLTYVVIATLLVHATRRSRAR
ncbi:MAG TPA: DUF2079 domain-containing protein, partial [Candidatus Didemnitutus sp.]|nr:DUF2079 domain-containing protein [Candidatus Didemnitutus sp.]